jgi:hypothetical protein
MIPVALVLSAALLAPAGAATCAPSDGGAACTPPSDEVRERVVSLLGAIDRPVRPETWRALGPEAEVVLAEVASSSELPSRRAKALEGLAAFAGPHAEWVHEALAADETAPVAVRRAAVRGLGRLLAADRLVGTLRAVLESDGAPSVRATAADVLARRAPTAGCAPIRAQARREGERGGLLFARALAACER